MAILEGRWDCPSCGAKGNLGRDKICPSCSDSRPEAVRFYLPQDAPVVSDAQQLAQAKAGPDWLCNFCAASNQSTSDKCSQCGAERGTAPTQPVHLYSPTNVPRSAEPPIIQPPTRKPLATTRTAAHLLQHPIARGIVVAAGLFGLVLIFLLWPRTRELVVRDVRWERKIEIEKLTTMREEAWSIPTGGRLVSQRQDVHHYDQVIDHYETRTRNVSEQVQVGTEDYVSGVRDMGNGYFEEQHSSRPIYETRTRTETYQEPIYRAVPVIATKYSYDIDRWMMTRSAIASNHDPSPKWPSTQLQDKERTGKRTETYQVVFEDNQQKSHLRTFDETKWRRFEVGQRCPARMNGFGHLLSVEPPD
jgi:hypothetical protein